DHPVNNRRAFHDPDKHQHHRDAQQRRNKKYQKIEYTHLRISNNLFSNTSRIRCTNCSWSFTYMPWMYSTFLSSLTSMIMVPGVSDIRLESSVISRSVFAARVNFTIPGFI